MRGILLALTLALPLPLAAEEVDLELVLLADASGSITDAEIAFQRQGYAAAITDPRVLDAIANTLTGRIALTYVEWAANQATVVEWTRIDGPEAAEAFAARLLERPRQAFGRNAIGAALVEGKRLIEGNAFVGFRRVIDFSGDSVNDYGAPPIPIAREQVLAAGITINGLPILCRDCPGGGRANLERDYAEQIIGGPGAFVVLADGRERFAEAVRRKLILEISGLTPDEAPQSVSAGP